MVGWRWEEHICKIHHQYLCINQQLQEQDQKHCLRVNKSELLYAEEDFRTWTVRRGFFYSKFHLECSLEFLHKETI